jgi:hypothetical protein
MANACVSGRASLPRITFKKLSNFIDLSMLWLGIDFHPVIERQNAQRF